MCGSSGLLQREVLVLRDLLGRELETSTQRAHERGGAALLVRAVERPEQSSARAQQLKALGLHLAIAAVQQRRR